MEIRPTAAVRQLGGVGRPAGFFGGKSGPTSIFSSVKDVVSLGGEMQSGAGLYSAKSIFKVMGAVELLSAEADGFDESPSFDDNPVL